MIGRRDFITLIGGAAAWPVAVRAQQSTMPVIGFLNSASLDLTAKMLQAFRQGLRESGVVEGQNVTTEYRWAENRIERLPELAAELVRRPVNVIAATGAFASVRAAKAATPTIPIVFQTGVNPVESGLVASLNQPSGNLTGVTTLSGELGPKRLDLLHQIVPDATDFGMLVNPQRVRFEDEEAAARALGLQIHFLPAGTEADFEEAFATLVCLRAGGLVIGADGFFVSRSEQLAALGLRHAIPAISQFREFAAAGGLMSYGTSFTDAYRLLGIYVGRILKGEKPADLPVQQVTKFELVINLKTAKALSLTVSPNLLAIADEVIE
jgi:putative ABC transport system substrate-binding protein